MDDGERDHTHTGYGFVCEFWRHPKATADAPDFPQFDYEQVFRNLDGPDVAPAGDRDLEAMGQVVHNLLAWIVTGDRPDAETIFDHTKRRTKRQRHALLKLVGRRALALAWVVDPKVLAGLSGKGLSDIGLPRAEKKDASQ